MCIVYSTWSPHLNPVQATTLLLLHTVLSYTVYDIYVLCGTGSKYLTLTCAGWLSTHAMRVRRSAFDPSLF